MKFRITQFEGEGVYSPPTWLPFRRNRPSTMPATLYRHRYFVNGDRLKNKGFFPSYNFRPSTISTPTPHSNNKFRRRIFAIYYTFLNGNLRYGLTKRCGGGRSDRRGVREKQVVNIFFLQNFRIFAEQHRRTLMRMEFRIVTEVDQKMSESGNAKFIARWMEAKGNVRDVIKV